MRLAAPQASNLLAVPRLRSGWRKSPRQHSEDRFTQQFLNPPKPQQRAKQPPLNPTQAHQALPAVARTASEHLSRVLGPGWEVLVNVQARQKAPGSNITLQSTAQTSEGQTTLKRSSQGQSSGFNIKVERGPDGKTQIKSNGKPIDAATAQHLQQAADNIQASINRMMTPMPAWDAFSQPLFPSTFQADPFFNSWFA